MNVCLCVCVCVCRYECMCACVLACVFIMCACITADIEAGNICFDVGNQGHAALLCVNVYVYIHVCVYREDKNTCTDVGKQAQTARP